MVLLATDVWPEGDAGSDSHARAPVAVLVHGMTASLRTWWRVGPALARNGWRAIGVDLRGHGDSQPMGGPQARQDLAADLAETIEALDVAPVDVLIGHSLGAAVALDLAHAQPELVRHVVLEEPPGTDRRDDAAFIERLEREAIAARERPDEELARILSDNPAWERRDAEHNLADQQRCDLEGIVASLRRGMGSRVVELVPILTVPALYLLAREDRSAIWGEQRERLLAGVPAGSRVVEIDAGHSIHRDRFDDYVRTLLDWLGDAARPGAGRATPPILAHGSVRWTG